MIKLFRRTEKKKKNRRKMTFRMVEKESQLFERGGEGLHAKGVPDSKNFGFLPHSAAGEPEELCLLRSVGSMNCGMGGGK